MCLLSAFLEVVLCFNMCIFGVEVRKKVRMCPPMRFGL
ncbi:hypothetical protein APHNYW_1440 [Anaplasma phagocytophilum str. ApNYW]|nr:hypothetical protein APHWEB_0621 [Anaplasma phagocytophilum str. Webster]KJV86503.1 hypothetical protein APHNYW_1440 [Anaplasma phagocytophilum str. ApNYW]